LVFKQLREKLGLAEFLSRYVAERGFEFDVVSAIFSMVLNRLPSSCSKLGESRWIEEVEEPSFAGLELRPSTDPWTCSGSTRSGLRRIFFGGGTFSSKEVDLVSFVTTRTVRSKAGSFWNHPRPSPVPPPPTPIRSLTPAASRPPSFPTG